MNEIPFESQRYRLDAAVRLLREGYPAIEGSLHDISLKGLFVACATTYPAGTRVRFQVDPKEPGLGALEGTMQIEWRRQLAAGRSRPAGMGCAFLEIRGDGRQRLREWNESHADRRIPRSVPDRSTLTTELARYKVSAAMRDTEPSLPESGSGVADGTRGGRGRRLALALAVVGLLATILLAFFQPWRTDTTQRSAATPPPDATQAEPNRVATGDDAAVAESPAAAAAGPEATGSAPQTAPGPDPDPAGATVDRDQPPGDDDERRAVRLAVRRWAAAWSSQDVDGYLASYAERFDPGGGSSREAWETQRRERITSPSFVRVTVEQLEVSIDPESATAVATFVQEYEAPGYADRVRKTLTLREDRGAWRIVEENSRPL
ncbi:MAG: hypothetical protein DWQ36_24220 [Acidobacteria bacterium]|nr:MAG: hypothetical protein DWQ30_07415 [Acidobacteriota bacterium]REK00255.1 MAG: hypothetical protein DWQ36_24220 [Acidobacteriota bacterium]